MTGVNWVLHKKFRRLVDLDLVHPALHRTHYMVVQMINMDTLMENEKVKYPGLGMNVGDLPRDHLAKPLSVLWIPSGYIYRQAQNKVFFLKKVKVPGTTLLSTKVKLRLVKLEST